MVSKEIQFFLPVVYFILQIIYCTGEQCDNGIFYHECLIGRCCKMGDKWKCIDPIGVDPFGPDPFAKCDSMSQYKPTTTMRYVYVPPPKRNFTAERIDNNPLNEHSKLSNIKENNWDMSNDRVEHTVSSSPPNAVKRLPTLAIVGIVGVNVFIIVVSVLVITFIKRRNSGSSAFGYVIQQNVV